MDNTFSDNSLHTRVCCMFRRRSTKKRIIDDLLVTNQQLSSAIAAGNQTNSSLFERAETKKKECQELKRKLQNIKEELNTKNEALTSTIEALETKTKNCQSVVDQLKEILLQNDNAEKTSSRLRATADSLEMDVKARTQELKEAKESYEKLQQVVVQKQEEINRHTLQNKSIQIKLQDSERRMKKMKNKCKMKLKEKEDVYASEARQVELKQQQLTYMESSLASAKEELVRAMKSVHLKKESILRLKKQKAQLMTYVHEKEAAFKIQLQLMHGQLKRLRKINNLNKKDLQRFTYTPDNFWVKRITELGKAEVTKAATPTIPCVEYLQTKVMELELRLFRRDKLIEVLEERIAAFQPGFSILTQPHLYVYLDDSKSQSPFYSLNTAYHDQAMIEGKDSYEQLGASWIGKILNGEETSDMELISEADTCLAESETFLPDLTREELMAQEESGKLDWKYEDSMVDEAYQSMYVDPYDSQDSNGKDTITVGSAELSENDIN